jgi:hypothetical protein
MLSRILLIAAATCLTASISYANAGCDAQLLQQYRECSRLVDSLRPDKWGLARVYAYDGSEFTAGQALWMKGQMREFTKLCASDSPADQAEAARILSQVQGLLQAHHRAE